MLGGSGGKMLHCILRPGPLQEMLPEDVTKHHNDATRTGPKRNETQERKNIYMYSFCYRLKNPFSYKKKKRSLFWCSFKY